MPNIQLYSIPLPGFAAKARSAIDQELVLLPRLRANDAVTPQRQRPALTATIITAKSTFYEMRSPGFAILELISTVLTIVVSGINLFP